MVGRNVSEGGWSDVVILDWLFWVACSKLLACGAAPQAGERGQVGGWSDVTRTWAVRSGWVGGRTRNGTRTTGSTSANEANPPQLRVLEAGVGRISPRGTLMITLAAFGLSVRASTLRPATARASRIGLMCSSNIVREDPAKRDSEGQDLSETFLLYEPPDNECMPLPPGELPLHALCRLQAAAAIMPPIMPPILPRLQLFLQF